MKILTALVTFSLLATYTFGQENKVTLSGGYAFAKVEDWDVNATGWRINGLYEFNPGQGKWVHGLSIGYVNLSATGTEGLNAVDYKISSWPVYYAPKYLFGSGNIKGYFKAALGWQFSHLERSAIVSLEDNDAGFTGGGGAGVSYYFNEKFFLTAEYELLWMSNSFYKDGLLNTASVGLGITF